MGASPSVKPDDTEDLLARAAAGDQEAWGALLARHRDRLRTMVALRLDPRLQGRLDPSDVLQEAFLTASLQLKDYADERSIPFFLWLRLVAGQKLVALHRHHLGKQLRDAGREVALYQGAGPEASSSALAARLLGQEAAPSEAALRAELALRFRAPSTAWRRSTARSSCCGISSSSATPRRPRSWTSSRPRPASATSGPCVV